MCFSASRSAAWSHKLQSTRRARLGRCRPLALLPPTAQTQPARLMTCSEGLLFSVKTETLAQGLKQLAGLAALGDF